MCFQVISAALGNFYAMHPPMLPNPSGDGLQYYKKRKPLRNPEDEENTSNNIGMTVHCWVFLACLFFLFKITKHFIL